MSWVEVIESAKGELLPLLEGQIAEVLGGVAEDASEYGSAVAAELPAIMLALAGAAPEDRRENLRDIQAIVTNLAVKHSIRLRRETMETLTNGLERVAQIGMIFLRAAIV